MVSATFTLPILNLPDPWPASVESHPPLNERKAASPRIEWIERKGRALHTSPYGANGDVLALNLARGCSHRCGFCAARANASHPGDSVMHVYGHTPQFVEEELASRRRMPRAVLISPATDPFPPSSEAQAETVRVIQLLASRRVEAWLMTRGFIRPFAMKTLIANTNFVKVMIGLTTVDRGLQLLLEHGAASPRLRFRQLARLMQSGVRVQVALDPLIPGLTDTSANLEPLLAGLARHGVRQVAASYMFLRPAIAENLRALLQPHGWDEMVLDAYAGGPVLASDDIAPARYLPRARRQRGYAALMALASRHGITVQVNALSNPDFVRAKSSIGEVARG